MIIFFSLQIDLLQDVQDCGNTVSSFNFFVQIITEIATEAGFDELKVIRKLPFFLIWQFKRR